MSRLWIVVLTVIVITAATTAFAKENVWLPSKMDGDPIFSEKYFAEIPGGDCSVYVKKDGGVFLSANEYKSSGETVTQVVETCGNVNYSYTRDYIYMTTKEGARHYDHGYPVFKVKCLSIVPQLPSEVRKEFFGYGGIGYSSINEYNP